METINVTDAARIKMVGRGKILEAVENGVLDSTGGRVEWNRCFENWMPPISEADLCYRANLARTYTTTIRIGKPLPRLATETARTAQSQAAKWDIVPLSGENQSLLLNMQRGSLDGSVCTEHLISDVQRALRLGEPVYQKRIHTGPPAYTQGLHPSPAFRSLDAYSRSAGDKSALGKAIQSGELDAARYHSAVLLVDNDALQNWREEGNDNSLFSQSLLRA